TVDTPGGLVNKAEKTQQVEADPTTANDSASVTLNAAASANLKILKAATRSTVSVGEPLTFNVVVVNLGPSPATGVRVSDVLPPGLTFVSSKPDAAYDATTGIWTVGALVVNAPAVLELTNAGLAMGLGPETLLYEALIPSLEEVGARFERGDFFVPEMLIAGKAMAGALEILRPLLAETGAASIGTIVMGTVKGDVHDIGKNLVNIMFEGAGFQVIDLGVQVAPEKFVDAVREHQPDIVGFSAFLTTTMPMFKANINALQKSGLRDQVIVMVGGAPVTQEYADVVGADGYAADASAAVVRAKELLQRRRAALPA
ncbi:MAG TPA: cobalamin-dependent protein, partial [Candidatus Saccharimonadia bacterium]|nr:cobalamin-dependent protein [Candidatus Saccharimonadia bacterium]